ncbi:hypothetical protein LIER_07827 [Lithospermum erythrorhizon]|uniref:Bet v I/Major latex protein domain-containing protein n=1 Tax=Lithospermum erythrorhizon TaxID=34254 RepID=A0AAV3PBP0_LITER
MLCGIRYVKYKIDVLDESSLSYADTMIEGGELSDKVEKVTHEIKFVSTSDGGCSANSVTKFYTIESAISQKMNLRLAKKVLWDSLSLWNPSPS